MPLQIEVTADDFKQLFWPHADNACMRPPRMILSGVPHHIILRGNNQRRLFSFEWERYYFIKLLREAKTDHPCDLHALALMDNHIHMLVTPPSQPEASAFVQVLSQRYAQNRNRLRGATGKLFEQRFESLPVTTERYLAVLTTYIDLNPVYAGECDDPLDAAWTTYGLHVGRPELSKVPSSLWTPSSWYLGLGDSRFDDYAAWAADCRAHHKAHRAANDDPWLRRPNKTRAR